MRRWWLIILMFSITKPLTSLAQGEEEPSKWSIGGYVKQMSTAYIIEDLDSLITDNLIHNRLNIKWYASDHFTFNLEVRNRIFFGELIKLIPTYGELLNSNNDFFDLSFNLIDRKSLIFNSTIDRFYLEYHGNDWEIRLGRQRINWGINVAWNPNDIFNAYSFFDFDYEERPGSDAIRIKKYTGIASSIEFASNFADRGEDLVVAGKWNTNKWNYDFQILGGKAKTDFVLGLGWAGNIKNAGFKGEVSWFKPLKNYEDTSFETLLISATVDYSFPNTFYISGSFLINTGIDEATSSTLNLLSPQRLDSKNLLPYPYATFLQGSYNITPLMVGSISWMTFPGESTFFINPAITYSLFDNFDVDLIGQLFYEKPGSYYKASSTAIFLRMKYSF